MSETDFLKLKKHDNVETNTEKFDIENYLNGNWDKINENAKEVNTNISNINLKDTELEKELKEAQEDFYQNSIRGQASGEYIHVEDSSNCRARIGIGGNHEQETSTQGRNYFTGNKIEGGTNIGVTYSFDNSILKLNGTTTKNGNILEKISTKVILPPGNYKFRAGLYAGSFERNSKDMAIYLSNKEDFVTGAYVSSGITLSSLGSVGSFTITENTELYVSIFVNGAGLVFNNTQLAILLVKVENDEDIGTFEQFVPNMPSPDYPSPINTVGSNVNLFDKDNYIKSKLYINKNENKFSEASMGKSFIFDISKYNKLTISKVSSERFGVFASVDYPQKDGVGTYLQDAATNTTSFSYDFAKFNYLVVFYYFSRDTLTEQEMLDSIKIVEGTEVGEYSSYGQGSVKVTKCNKNLFGKYVTGIWLDTSKKLYTVISTTVGFIARVKPNTTYTIKKKNKGNRFILTAGKEPVKIGNAFSRLIFASNNDLTQYTFTTKENEYYIFLGVYNGTDENELVLAVEETQLEQNPTATNYEEHQEQSYIMPIQQPMRSIGDIRDTFIKKENKWYERHYVQRLILNGTEGWNYDKNNNRFYFAKAGNKGSGYIMSSHYLRGDTTKQNNTCEIWSSAILFRDERFTEREDFKNMIKAKYDEGIPVYVDYVSITPTDIECTEEQSQILDELNNARTYKNVTNITTDSKAILSLDYAKDLETLLNNTQALAVNNASEGV